jgi:hypothetical protein
MAKEMRFPKIFASGHQWNLYSSSGWRQFGGSFVAQSRNDAGVDLLLANVSIEGQFWRPRAFEKADEEHWQLAPSFTVGLPLVVMQRGRIAQLISDLDEWLTGRKKICIDLTAGAEPDQTFVFTLGARNDGTLARSECWLMCSANAFASGEWRFLVDQSCVRIFFEELSTALAGVDGGE